MQSKIRKQTHCDIFFSHNRDDFHDPFLDAASKTVLCAQLWRWQTAAARAENRERDFVTGLASEGNGMCHNNSSIQPDTQLCIACSWLQILRILSSLPLPPPPMTARCAATAVCNSALGIEPTLGLKAAPFLVTHFFCWDGFGFLVHCVALCTVVLTQLLKMYLFWWQDRIWEFLLFLLDFHQKWGAVCETTPTPSCPESRASCWNLHN